LPDTGHVIHATVDLQRYNVRARFDHSTLAVRDSRTGCVPTGSVYEETFPKSRRRSRKKHTRFEPPAHRWRLARSCPVKSSSFGGRGRSHQRQVAGCRLLVYVRKASLQNSVAAYLSRSISAQRISGAALWRERQYPNLTLMTFPQRRLTHLLSSNFCLRRNEMVEWSTAP
jgi:hypothetical protein